jgi:hypothetical protein
MPCWLEKEVLVWHPQPLSKHLLLGDVCGAQMCKVWPGEEGKSCRDPWFY